MAHTSGGPVCHQIQSKTPQVCVSCTGSSGLEGEYSESFLGEFRRVPPGGEPGQSSGIGVRPRLSSVDPDCSGLAKHALVLGSGQPFSASFAVSTQVGKSSNPTIQQVSIPLNLSLHAWLLEPRASKDRVSVIKWQ